MFHNKSFCNKLLANILSEIANEISQKQKFFFFERKYLQYLVFSEKQNTIGKKKKIKWLFWVKVMSLYIPIIYSFQEEKKKRWYSFFGYCFASPAKEIISSFGGKKERVRFHPLVKWELIQLPKKYGGLGVGDLVLKNKALLFKWWWRFSEDNNSLWKKVICSCNNLRSDRLVNQQPIIRGLGPSKDICNIWNLNKEVE